MECTSIVLLRHWCDCNYSKVLLPGQPLTHRACNQVDQWRTCPTMFHPPIHPLNKQLFVLSVRWWWSVRLVLVLATNNGHVPSSQSVSMCSIRRACCFCAALPSHQFVVKWVFRRTVSFVRLRNAMPSLPVGNGLIGNASGEHAKCASGRSLARSLIAIHHGLSSWTHITRAHHIRR